MEIDKAIFDPDGPVMQLVNRELLDNAGIVSFATIPYGAIDEVMGLMGRGDPIVLPEDVGTNRKLRVLGDLDRKLAAALGMRVTHVTSAETYIALMNGTLNCVTGTPEHMYGRKFIEVLDWYTPGLIIGGGEQAHSIGVNEAFFYSLPADLQQAIEDASREVYEERADANYKRALVLYERLEEEEKLSLHVLTPEERAQWDEIIGPFVGDYLKEKGPSAVQAYNLCQDILKMRGLAYSYIT
jgi:C4-dicarboxylate-binding protein DctP